MNLRITLPLLCAIGACAPPPVISTDPTPVGYGAQEARVVTGSLRALPVPLALRQGRLADFLRASNVATSSPLRLRNAPRPGAPPLFVVDGQIVASGPGGGLPWLAMQDVERVFILRDGASCAMYGARGAGGVVLITTRR